MKTNFYLLLRAVKYFYLFVFLMVAACSRFTGNHDNPQSQNTFAPDSLWTPTGDAMLDSLLQLAAVAPQDTSLALLYYHIGFMYIENNHQKAKDYFLKIEALSEELDWNYGRYMYASYFSNLLAREFLSDSAVVVLQRALELAKREKNEWWIARFHHSIGNAYFMSSWFETALRYYMEALPIYEQRNDSRHMKNVYFMISQIYNNIDVIDKAIEYGEMAVALNPEDVTALFVLAKAYLSARENEKARDYFKEVLRLCELQNNLYTMERTYYYLAHDALKAYDLERAESYMLQSLKINEQLGPGNCVYNYIQLGQLEMIKGNYDKSEKYVKEALEIATQLELFDGKKQCYKILAELAIAQRKYREVLQYWDEVDLLEKALAKEKTIIAAQEMAAKYETEKKELEIERQQHIISNHIMQRSMLVGGVAVCIIILTLLWYMLRLLKRRNRALAEMNATKDKFFSIISHDLKNPAIAQRDAIQLLVKNAHSWDADTLTDYYHELLKSAEGQVELVYNLLGWAQMQTERMIYTPDTFLLSDLLSNISLVRNMAENKKIALTTQIPQNTLVTCDSNMLSVVVRNLLINAVKFTPTGGQVALTVEPLGRNDERNVSTSYTVSVSDTGVGMSREQVQKLFRLDCAQSRTGTDGEQGTGLGLIVSREFLRKHGTKLHVDSEEGKGSRFWFELRMEN